MTIATYDLGKWYPENGPYAEWEVNRLREFVKDHIIMSVDRCDLPSGGSLLLVDGYEKEKYVPNHNPEK